MLYFQRFKCGRTGVAVFFFFFGKCGVLCELAEQMEMYKCQVEMNSNNTNEIQTKLLFCHKPDFALFTEKGLGLGVKRTANNLLNQLRSLQIW